MLAEVTPGSCWHACRIELIEHDILRAMPMFVRPPISAQGSASGGIHRIFPRRCGEYGACSDAPARLDGPWDYHSLYPGRDVEVARPPALAARPRWPRASSRAASCRARWLRLWQCQGDHHRLRPRDCASPLVPAVGGMTAYQVAAHAGFAHGGIGGWPPPVDAAQLLTGVYQNGPNLGEDSQGTPALEVPMHGAVVAKLFGQLVPLAAGAQAKDDTVEHPAQIDPSMPFGLGRIDLIEDLLNERPHIVRDFPNGWLHICVHALSPGLCHTGE